MVYVGRAIWYALLLMVATRILNRRTTVSEKPYDFAVNVTYGTLAGAAILNLVIPIWGGTLAIATLTAFAWLANLAAYRSDAVSRLLAGRSTPLVEHGAVRSENLRRLHMKEEDLRAKLRELKVASVADVEYAAMETDGNIGVVTRGGG